MCSKIKGSYITSYYDSHIHSSAADLHMDVIHLMCFLSSYKSMKYFAWLYIAIAIAFSVCVRFLFYLFFVRFCCAPMQKREKGTTAQIEDEGADTHPDAALSYAEYSHALAFIQLLGDGRWAPPAGRHFHFYLQACRSPRHPALHVDSNFTKKCSRLLLSQSRGCACSCST